jgi:hypothetical protein
MLAGGDRRSIGRANEVAELLHQRRSKCDHVIALLFDSDQLVRMRAADALEKASAQDARLIRRFKSQLISLLCQAEQKELRWHLALMAPRLVLRAADRERAVAALKRYLEDRSSIVKTCALEALARISIGDEESEREMLELLHQAERGGTAAMRARARKLLRTREP